MQKRISIIGGDLRLIKLAQMLANDNFKVYVFGLEKSHEIKEDIRIIKCETLKDAIKNSDIIIGPVPFSSNGIDINAPFANSKISIEEIMENTLGKVLIAGSIEQKIYTIANEYTHIIDLMKREELAVLNTIATAEGAIEVAIANTNKILHGSKVLVLGFGRVGKVLARKLIGLSANVTCAARKNEDIAWIKTYGYEAVNINQIEYNLSQYEIIINTVPDIILTREKLQFINKDALIIDLASNPGGVDQNVVKAMNIKFVWALSLPGKVAPITSAEFIKDTIYNILSEENF
jgi:dipicolinate synthase subunit A